MEEAKVVLYGIECPQLVKHKEDAKEAKRMDEYQRNGEKGSLPTVDRLDDLPELAVIGFENRCSKDQDIDNDV
jgi:hypothetical protein